MFDSVKHGHLNVTIIDFHYILLYAGEGATEDWVTCGAAVTI